MSVIEGKFIYDGEEDNQKPKVSLEEVERRIHILETGMDNLAEGLKNLVEKNILEMKKAELPFEAAAFGIIKVMEDVTKSLKEAYKHITNEELE